jgi:hypothetical protein
MVVRWFFFIYDGLIIIVLPVNSASVILPLASKMEKFWGKMARITLSDVYRMTV